MKLNIFGRKKGYLLDHFFILLNAGFAAGPATRSIPPQTTARNEGVIRRNWSLGVFAASAAALASTGFLIAMAMSGGFQLG
jgi:hypothetical protein